MKTVCGVHRRNTGSKPFHHQSPLQATVCLVGLTWLGLFLRSKITWIGQRTRGYDLIELPFLDLYLSCNAQVVFMEWRSLCSFDLLLTELLCVQIWSPTAAMPPPSPYKFAIFAVFKGFLYMAIYRYLMIHFAIHKLSEPEYLEWGFWHRAGYQYLCAFTARWKYYIVWSLSEASMIISGFGFSGWTKASPSQEQQPKWTRAQNVDILRVELPKSAVDIPQYWNIHVGIWLRHCIHFAF